MIGLSLFATAAFATDSPPDLAVLSLEDLMNIKVTSVSKRAERLSEAPAAIYVLTSEDIRRSGASTIPDALRMVPGIQVARIDANKWAISARGFNLNFANKLLVLIDGRSVYTPFFSGVFWDVQDVLLEDVDRIEVIRGPGATLWGANAVNGVINVITKSTQNTHGTIVSAGGGVQERGFVGMRHGGAVGETGSYRVYGKYFDRSHSVYADGSPATDNWSDGRAGFRIDYERTASQTLTAQGDIYQGHAGAAYHFPSLESPYEKVIEGQTERFGGNVLARWTRRFSASSDASVQAYYDYTSRHDFMFNDHLQIIDIDAHHCIQPGSRQQVVYGFGYRRTIDDFPTPDADHPVKMIPESRSDNLFSSFVQSEIELSRSKLWLVIGSKFEHNDYTGLEFQPSVRARWSVSDHHMAWAAVSRAARTPSRTECEGVIEWSAFPPLSADNPTTVPLIITLYGNESYISETLMAYEAGLRSQVRENLLLDLSAYVNVYANLRTAVQGMPTPVGDPPTYSILPISLANDVKGVASGGEIALDWEPRRWLRFRGGYAYLNIDCDAPGTFTADEYGFAAGYNPRHGAFVRGIATIPRGPELDLALRAVDELSYSSGVSGYVELDARVGLAILRNMSVALAGRNLLNPRHTEFRSELAMLYTEVERTVYGTINWKY